MPRDGHDRDVTAAIQRGDVEAVYCLHGPERYLIDRCLDALRKAVLGGDGRGNGFNSESYDLKETSLDAVVGSARTMPMFAKRRFVLARGIDQVKADDLVALVEYTADPNPTTCLVLVGDKVDGRLRAFQALKKRGFLHEFARLRDGEAATWLRGQASARKVKLEPDAAMALAESAGPDLGKLSLALDQLALFAGEGAAVTRAHVETLVADTRERDVFDLTKAIGGGQRERALHLCGNLLRNGEHPVRIHFMLVRQLRQVWRAKELLGAGAPRGEIAAQVKINPYFLDDVLLPARRMSGPALDRSFRRLYQADWVFKQSRVDSEIAIVRLVRELCDDASAADKAKATP